MELEITFFGSSHSVFELTCSLTGSKSSSRSVSGTLHEAPSENLMTSSSFTLSIFPTQESITTSQNELLRGWTKTSRLIVLFHFNTVCPINSICRLLWLTFIVFNSILSLWLQYPKLLSNNLLAVYLEFFYFIFELP